MSFARRTFIAGLFAAGGFACGSEPGPARSELIHVRGDHVVDPSGAPLALEGMGFVDGEAASAYTEVAAMGLSFVRLYFDASSLEDGAAGSYSSAGLAALDDDVAHARDNGLYLMLAMSLPPGGTPFNCGNDAFWDSAEYQDRFVDLWRMLAARYAHEPAIAGYAILDLPNPNYSLQQWQALADRTTRAIRAVDRGHMLDIAGALSVSCQYDAPPSETFVRVDDPNVIYEFARLQPWDYVAQLTADDPSGTIPEYGPYPNETRLAIDPTKATWLHTPLDTRPSAKHLQLKPDETEWTQKKFYYTIPEPRFAYAVPVLQADSTAGKVYFDDVLIEEVAENGEARVVEAIEVESVDDWQFWQGDEAGRKIDGPGMQSTEKTAFIGKSSVAISGSKGLANLSGRDWSRFPVQVGQTYRVTSWIKGEGIGPDSDARVRLDFWSYSEPIHGFDRKTLESLFNDFAAWGRVQGVPMSVSAFGTARPTFQNERGGLLWVSDMIDIMREQQLSWAYWAYRDENFGIYTNARGAPDPTTANQPLVELFTDKLH